MFVSECFSSFIDQRSYWWMNVLFSIQLTDRMHCAARQQQPPIMQMWSNFSFDTSEEMMHGGSIVWNQTLFLHSCLSGVFLVFMCCCYCHWFAAYSKQNTACHLQISVFHQREPKQHSTNWLKTPPQHIIYMICFFSDFDYGFISTQFVYPNTVWILAQIGDEWQHF